MPKSISNSFCANETLLRSRNAMTYISSRNGISRLNTFFVASSLRSCRRWAATGWCPTLCLLAREAGSRLVIGVSMVLQGGWIGRCVASGQCMYLPPSTWMVAPLI